MKHLKQFLLSKRVVLSLILLILAAVVVGYIFPQRFSTSQEQFEIWHEAHPDWTYWIDRLGLDHVYTTPWFAALLLIFLTALIVSTIDQIKLSYKRTVGPGSVPDTDRMNISSAEDTVVNPIKKAGYVLAYQDDSTFRFVRHRWGFWGNALLHAGMCVVIASSLLIVLTEKRGLIHLIEGETFYPGDTWIAEETGISGGKFILPDAVRLEQAHVEFWETDEVKYQSTVFSFVDPAGNEKQRTVGINLNVSDRGLRIYQGRNFGDAFYVTLTGPEGTEIKRIFQLQHPLKRHHSGFHKFSVEEIPYLLEAGYFPDAETKFIESKNPLLIMRLVRTDKAAGAMSRSYGDGERSKIDRSGHEKIVAEVFLKIGERKPFGPYAAELVHVTKWTGLIFTRNTGMPGIFAGFLIIIIGVALSYFVIPREIYVTKEGDKCYIACKAAKFKSLYEDEFAEITREIIN